MSNKTLDILKGSFFALIFIFCLITRIKDAAALGPTSAWSSQPWRPSDSSSAPLTDTDLRR